tara:strand:- start:282 stop:425 length:144 start_codon:yes stop_codon:yes gene_type:complete
VNPNLAIISNRKKSPKIVNAPLEDVSTIEEFITLDPNMNPHRVVYSR